MDKQKEFEKVVREHLGLKEDVEIVDIAVTIKRNEVIHLPGPTKLDIVVNMPDDIADNKSEKGKGITEKRKYKKRTKAKIDPYTGEKRKGRGRSFSSRLNLTVTDDNIEYAKKRLQQWMWTKKFVENELDFWNDLKGGSIKNMTVEHKDNLINFYNSVAKRMAGE